MSFFRDQARARSNTKWLVLFFLLAVSLIILAVYLLFASFLANGKNGLWEPRLLLWIGGSITLLIGGSSLYKVTQLGAGGGAAVAQAMDARLVHRNSTDLLEQRLLNIVDEMAIASGINVPQVFVMDNEAAINAFAAGSRPSEAVVAVTRGCLEQLNRDELQGVIGHEFSHIFNGDMRLNLRLMGVLHGILVIALIGRSLMHIRPNSYSSNARSRSGVVLLGLALFCIGYIGVFFGKLIKAAVSRQREFLADAAAVQFTRNPQGIASALKKIAGYSGGTQLNTPNAEQASHMFFASALSGWLNTHPPLEERIARLEPSFRAPKASTAAGSNNQNRLHASAKGFAVSPASMRDSIGVTDHQHLEYADQLLQQLPDTINQALHNPQQAASLLYALLLTPESDPAAILQQHLPSTQCPVGTQALAHLPWLKQCGRAYWLPLVELALPALRELTQSEQLEIMRNTQRLARADGKINLFEFALLAIVEQQLGRKQRLPIKRPSLRAIRDDLNLLLSLLAHVGKNNPDEIQTAFTAATALIPLEADWKLSKPKSTNLGLLLKLLERLNSLNYNFKGKIIEACTAAILANGHVSLVEAELLRAIGARLECPVPPLIAH